MSPARVGLLCPGQGSQHVGMGKDLADAFPEAAETFAAADDALGAKLSRICWEGPEEELTRTVNAQPALLAHSLAVWSVLQRRTPTVTMAAGHSLGEFSAYAAAGSLSFADAIRTVRKRGELMFESGQQRPGTMAAVLGLDDAVVDEVCSDATAAGDGVVIAANFNSPGQVVISGDVSAVERAEGMLKGAGAKRVVRLNVSGAFHSPLMEVAEEPLRAQLEEVQLRDPEFAVISNVTANPITDASEARLLLVEQLTSAVRWSESMRTLLASGVESMIEVGPGNVLAGLIRRIDRQVPVRSLGTAEEVEAFLREEG